jgi:hypothetical protein
MSNNADQPQYLWSIDEATGIVTKQELSSDRTWTWKVKPRPKKAKCSPKNGVSIQKIADAGHKVRVRHFRWAYYLGTMERASGRNTGVSFKPRPIVIPSSFRRDPLYSLLPKGGYTHITIRTKDDEYVCLSSECSPIDPFCYTTGVEKALERLTHYELEYLGLLAI